MMELLIFILQDKNPLLMPLYTYTIIHLVLLGMEQVYFLELDQVQQIVEFKAQYTRAGLLQQMLAEQRN